MISSDQDSYGGQRQLSDRPWDGGRGQSFHRGPLGALQAPMQMHPNAMLNGANILAAVGQQVLHSCRGCNAG